jgi:hypothetical protein
MWSALTSPYAILVSGVASLFAIRWYIRANSNNRHVIRRPSIPSDDDPTPIIQQKTDAKRHIFTIEGNLTTESVMKILIDNVANLDPQVATSIDKIRNDLNKYSNLGEFSSVFICDEVPQGFALIKSSNKISPVRSLSIVI